MLFEIMNIQFTSKNPYESSVSLNTKISWNLSNSLKQQNGNTEESHIDFQIF